MVDLPGASVADIRRFIQTSATLPFKVWAGLVACQTGSTLNAAKNNLATGICLPAVVAVDTEVLGIIA